MKKDIFISEIFPLYISGRFQSWKLLDSLRYPPFSYLLPALPNQDEQFSLAFHQKPLKIKLKISFIRTSTYPIFAFLMV